MDLFNIFELVSLFTFVETKISVFSCGPFDISGIIVERIGERIAMSTLKVKQKGLKGSG
jgi:hypothetical protein